jgi:cellulose synthase/poly-beta-1,6-N-acetylglucosamine synthase-like glycosyltransferase
MTARILFWFLLSVIFYSYIGYGLLLAISVRIKRLFRKIEYSREIDVFEPPVCLFVTAYNEKDYIRQKVNNSFSLNYPEDKIQYIWITDGSDDGTPDLLREYHRLEVYHQKERKGKIDAMNRGMKFVRTPYVIFSDTNTILSCNTIRDIVACFANPEVGCIAGEKRIADKKADTASGSGEGLYWKMESHIKLMESELSSAVGGVGELFAIRTELFEPVENDTILDDFIISMRIASKGYRIAYTPGAYAIENASLNVKEELKRKIRISAGGIQAMTRLWFLLNPFKYGIFSWQYFSHKVLRWAASPLSLFLFLPVNIWLVAGERLWFSVSLPSLILWVQLLCYLLALSGWIFENRRIKTKIFFAPAYFVAINYASVRGLLRFLWGKQKVTWEKSKRAGTPGQETG